MHETAGGIPTREPPHILTGAPWHQRWLEFTAIHWPYPPAVVQARLPRELTSHTFDGQAWVGLTPLVMDDVRPIGLSALPAPSFPELNVRTFVIGPDGRKGLWFFSLEAAFLPFVLAARAAYGVPYTWARMKAESPEPALRHYVSRRIWPGPTDARAVITAEVGEAIPEDQLTDLDIFVTTRWHAYSRHVVGLMVTGVEHPPWPLHRATLRRVDETLLAAAGLPPPEGSPQVHYSPGVTVRLGLPRRVVPGGTGGPD